MNDLDINKILENMEDELNTLDHIKFQIEKLNKEYEDKDIYSLKEASKEIKSACRYLEDSWGDLDTFKGIIESEANNEYE